jgi:hypothetical protein
MDHKLPFISYTLAAMSGICLMGGLVILSREGRHPNVQTRGTLINARPIVRH